MAPVAPCALKECSTSGRTIMPRPSRHSPPVARIAACAVEREEDLDRMMRMGRHLAAGLRDDEKAALP